MVDMTRYAVDFASLGIIPVVIFQQGYAGTSHIEWYVTLANGQKGIIRQYPGYVFQFTGADGIVRSVVR